jgi:HTH-type transcriptional regulator / antitoxin HipB
MHRIEVKMTLPELGQQLREARRSRRLSQGELAASLGMSRATISAIENGTVGEIGIRKVMALATALGLELFLEARRDRPTLQQLREERWASNTGT